jgi:hypothetical protein
MNPQGSRGLFRSRTGKAFSRGRHHGPLSLKEVEELPTTLRQRVVDVANRFDIELWQRDRIVAKFGRKPD